MMNDDDDDGDGDDDDDDYVDDNSKILLYITIERSIKLF